MNKKHTPKENQEYHDSFGMIKMSRVFGSAGYMFGSEIKHHSFVKIEIDRCFIEHDSKFRDFGEEKILPFAGNAITIYLTNNQFAQFITSENMGYGTPCTITCFDDKDVERLPEKQSTRVDRANEELIEFLKKDYASHFEKLKNAYENSKSKSRLCKEDKESIENAIYAFLNIFERGEKILIKEFEEVLEKSKQQVLSEIDATIGIAIQQKGLELIKKELLQIKEDNNDN